jgi:hypothetical protein
LGILKRNQVNEERGGLSAKVRASLFSVSRDRVLPTSCGASHQLANNDGGLGNQTDDKKPLIRRVKKVTVILPKST